LRVSEKKLRRATAILFAFALAIVSFAEDATPATPADITPAAQGAQPVESRNVTLDEAVELALANNIQLASDAIDLRIKKRSSEYAWNVFIPSASVSGTLARSNKVSNPYASILQSMGVPTEKATEKDHWSMAAGLSIGLTLNAALVEGLTATRQSYEAGKLTFEQARQDTERNVRKAFYGILVQQESLKLLREKLAASEDRLKQAQINYRNGIVPELTVLQSQLSVETQKPALREAEIALDQQKKLFAFIIGLPVNAEVTLVGAIDPAIKSFDEDELVSKYLATRLDIAILGKNLELLNTQVRATRLQLFTPSVALSQSWLPMKAPIDSGEWTDGSGAFSVTVAFDLIGLVPFSKAGLSLAESEDGVEKLKLAKGQAEYSAELEIRDLVKKLDKARASIATMDLSVSIAEKAYRLTEQAYRAGSVEYLDLKDAENSLLQAQLGVLTEKYNYLSTLLDLETAVNARLD
jgi:outer membrane protein TolC